MKNIFLSLFSILVIGGGIGVVYRIHFPPPKVLTPEEESHKFCQLTEVYGEDIQTRMAKCNQEYWEVRVTKLRNELLKAQKNQ